ncbi:transcriptional regulator [Staphylococcus gallinarum]|uniref:transcriptional regulator n=1 Tax=Staphylococcus gallinarum TaxID=1293 RepID=UPI001E2AD804|nr:transcriptional regulator [Staphylococcus gallinarum]MCD8825418.1 transcriptional regulator [Staphylococcus gallinarum]
MKLSKPDLKKVEEFWENLNNMKGQLAYRRYELLYQPTDTNIGGGKSNLISSSIEREVIKLHEDELYTNLSKTITAIEDIYRNATPEQKEIADYRYWEKDILIYEWEDIAQALTEKRNDGKIISVYSVLRLRRKMMEETAKRIGYIHFD